MIAALILLILISAFGIDDIVGFVTIVAFLVVMGGVLLLMFGMFMDFPWWAKVGIIAFIIIFMKDEQ